MNPIEYISQYYGLDKQLDQLVEECSELIKAVQKYKRHSNSESVRDILEEIADTEIMTSQIKLLTGGNATVCEFKEYKINRQIDRIKNQEAIQKCS